MDNADFSGIMIIGVMNKKSNISNKMWGSIVNYTLNGGSIRIKLYLDANKRKLIVFSPSKPDGEIFSDLPRDGIFFPAIQNKTQKINKNSTAKLFVQYRFELPVPSDKSKIRYLSDENDDDAY